MTYIDLINNFWERYYDDPFSSAEVHLYFFLLNEYNRNSRTNAFELSNRRILLTTGLSEKTVIAARNRLVQRGLLKFDAGQRRAKSPIYYLDLDWNNSSKEVSKKGGKKGGKEVSKTGSSYIRVKSIESNTPQPPEGDVAPSLNSKARILFEEHFKSLFGEAYYWQAKDAGGMSSIIKKLKFQREQKGYTNTDDEVLNALKVFLGTITDGWLFQNFSVSNINSKFNEVISNAKEKNSNGKQQTTTNKYEQKRNDSERRQRESMERIVAMREEANRRRKEIESVSPTG